MTTTPPKYALLFVEGERAGEAIGLDAPEVTVGRSRQNQVTLNDEMLSRKHMVFRRLGDDLMLEDLDSAHGTFLNEKRLRGILSVQPGDVVTAGAQKIKVALYAEVAGLVAAPGAAAEATEAEGDEDADAKTRFGGEEDLDETRYHQAHDAAYDEEDDDAKTRVLADQATRMLDVEELQGLKAGKGEATDTRKLLLGILLLVVLLGGGGYALIRYYGGGAAAEDVEADYEDAQYAFRLTYPGVWEKSGSDPAAAIVFEYREGERVLANCKVFADQSLQHEITGLSLGFRESLEDLEARHPGFRLKGFQTMDINGIRLVQFGYDAEAATGFGLFTFNGGTRYLVETAAVRGLYQRFKEPMLDILRSFRLEGDQTLIDFPLADEAIRLRALGDPQGLAEEARVHARLGEDLLKRRTVKLDNLYNAVDHFRQALQRTSALSTRPDFHEETARELLEATRQLNEAVADQKYKITMAEKTGDLEAARFELSKLMRMVPDKNDPVYRVSEKKYKQYGGK